MINKESFSILLVATITLSLVFLSKIVITMAFSG
jgi:hypothetical protein